MALTVVLPAKILFQSLWDLDLAWDDPLPPDKNEAWNDILRSWEEQSIRLPRRLPVGREVRYQLHAFADASTKAYATVIYLVALLDGRAESYLVFSKSRLQPRKAITLPRLELMAALIGTRALQFVSTQLHLPVDEHHLWSDSMIALQWVENPERLERFVENRVREIRQHTHIRFHHVESAQNPADVASRGCTPQELNLNHMWWHGPQWLVGDTWPHTYTFNLPRMDPPPAAPVVAMAVVEEQPQQHLEQMLGRVNSWSKALRATANALKFTRKAKKLPGLTLELTNDDLKEAERLLIRRAQEKHPPSEAEIHTWNLRKDVHGIWRVSTRLTNADHSPDWKNPPLIPRESSIRPLLALHCHAEVLHAGVDASLAAFLGRYWTPQSRRMMKTVKKACQKCRRWTATPLARPQMPPLPPERVTASRPFQFTGVDYLGPTLTRCGETKQKAWICLFTCFTTRAIHLEVVLNMSTQSFLNALTRFVSRRGCSPTMEASSFSRERF